MKSKDNFWCKGEWAFTRCSICGSNHSSKMFLFFLCKCMIWQLSGIIFLLICPTFSTLSPYSLADDMICGFQSHDLFKRMVPELVAGKFSLFSHFYPIGYLERGKSAKKFGYPLVDSSILFLPQDCAYWFRIYFEVLESLA